jgi:hypothetical protein
MERQPTEITASPLVTQITATVQVTLNSMPSFGRVVGVMSP